ncbi:DUF262 domain-containing protein [Streptomyces sp. NPDC002574]|uniref:DUF262 domain-containing protein n=1 Tax=Streptomyces sp. NPDC002574 TaxID=3364652 RepID=UPI0036B696B5
MTNWVDGDPIKLVKSLSVQGGARQWGTLRMAALDNVKLKELLADVASGTLQLPDFQREWKWDDDRIRAIIATVTLDYPLGVVMTL